MEVAGDVRLKWGLHPVALWWQQQLRQRQYRLSITHNTFISTPGWALWRRVRHITPPHTHTHTRTHTTQTSLAADFHETHHTRALTHLADSVLALWAKGQHLFIILTLDLFEDDEEVLTFSSVAEY